MLDSEFCDRLIPFAGRLIDQDRARPIVSPQANEPGYWFGGGNMIEHNGLLYLVGRYRNAGDSRTGLARGERGLELAIFVSTNRGESFDKVKSFSKRDLDLDSRAVLSIEGSALHAAGDRVTLYVSTERDGVGYPAGFEEYLKPGTGVWSIERIVADSIENLDAATAETILSSTDPRFVHVKDPFLYAPSDEPPTLMFCSHPYCWTSSNTGYVKAAGAGCDAGIPVFDFFPRGFTWDIAMTRGTCLVDVPPIGPFAESPVSLMFYDGGECVRNHDEHQQARTRPRGYSCEELGGLAWCPRGDWHALERLSVHRPLFVSPHGTGCSRYVDVLATDKGFYATWQQSQPDGSQPLVMNFVSRDIAETVLR